MGGTPPGADDGSGGSRGTMGGAPPGADDGDGGDEIGAASGDEDDGEGGDEIGAPPGDGDGDPISRGGRRRRSLSIIRLRYM